MLRLVIASSGRIATHRACSQAQRALASPGPATRSSLSAVPAARPFSGTTVTQLRGSTMAASAFGNIDVKGAKELVESKASQYVDVRTEEEYAAGHCPGAANLPVMLKQGGAMTPNAEFVKQFEAAFPDKEAALCIGCQSGKRSEMAAGMLSAAGYKNLTNVEGGFMAWMGAGLPVEK